MNVSRPVMRDSNVHDAGLLEGSVRAWYGTIDPLVVPWLRVSLREGNRIGRELGQERRWPYGEFEMRSDKQFLHAFSEVTRSLDPIKPGLPLSDDELTAIHCVLHATRVGAFIAKRLEVRPGFARLKREYLDGYSLGICNPAIWRDTYEMLTYSLEMDRCVLRMAAPDPHVLPLDIPN